MMFLLLQLRWTNAGISEVFSLFLFIIPKFHSYYWPPRQKSLQKYKMHLAYRQKGNGSLSLQQQRNRMGSAINDHILGEWELYLPAYKSSDNSVRSAYE